MTDSLITSRLAFQRLRANQKNIYAALQNSMALGLSERTYRVESRFAFANHRLATTVSRQ